MAVGKRGGTQLLIVAIAGALMAALVMRALESGGGAGVGRDTSAAAATPPSASPGADALPEPAPPERSFGVETPAAVQDSPGEPPSLEQRASAVIRKMAESMGSVRDSGYVDDLVRSGLSRADSEIVARRFFADVAACAFEDARRQNSAQGADYAQFVAVAEQVWNAPKPARLTVESVALRAMPCVTDAAQRAAIALPHDLMARYAALDSDLVPAHGPDLTELPPGWARSMESAIRAHVASFPAGARTSLEVHCEAAGCSVIMGRDVPVYDLSFDVFAEQNGFDHAVVYGGGDRRVVLLQR